MKKYLLIFVMTSIFVSCAERPEETDNLPSDVFEVTTLGISIDCGLNVLKFDEKDLDRLELLVGEGRQERRDLREGLNLDRERFGDPNLKLKVRIRKVLDSEVPLCTTRGISYPSIFVIGADPIENQ
jgi:hypothetical protein